jgi:DNA gyrase subunit A
VGALPEINRPKERGQLLSGVLFGLDADERMVSLLCVKPGELNGMPDLLFVTRQGMIKRSEAAEYDVRRQKFTAIALKNGDSLCDVFRVPDTEDLLLVSQNAMTIRFALSSVPAMGRATGGVKAMLLEAGDSVILAVPPSAGSQLLLVTERGCAKRLLMSDFDRQNRNGRGVRAFIYNKNGSNGSVIVSAIALADTACRLIFCQAQSQPTLLSAKDIILMPKTGKGKPYVLAILDDVVTDVIAVPLP